MSDVHFHTFLYSFSLSEFSFYFPLGVIDGLFLDQILAVLYLVFLLVFVPVLEV
jgi:hypothetical protein